MLSMVEVQYAVLSLRCGSQQIPRLAWLTPFKGALRCGSSTLEARHPAKFETGQRTRASFAGTSLHGARNTVHPSRPLVDLNPWGGGGFIFRLIAGCAQSVATADR